MTKYYINDIEKLSLNENSQQIIIKLDPNEIFFFEHNTYNPLLLSEIITRKKYDKIINDAEKVLCEAFVKKEKYEKIYINAIIYILYVLILILFFIYFILLYFSIRKKNGKKYLKIGLFMAIIGLLLLISLFLYNILRKHTLGKLTEEFVIQDLDNYCLNINKNLNEKIKFFYNKFNKTLVCEILITKINNNSLIESNKNKISTNNNFNEISINNKINNSEIFQNSEKILSTERNLSTNTNDNFNQINQNLIKKKEKII